MANFRIIDSHVHCGVQNVSWGWEKVQPLLKNAGIRGAGLIPPVEDIYDRDDPRFLDSPEWQAARRRAHDYLLALNDPEIDIFPYFFVWNDFAREDLGPEYAAIKWHRHAGEPEYRYGDPRCREFIEAAREKKRPILLEETFENTLNFLDKLAPHSPVILPHLGGLNGGYEALEKTGVWERPQVYADTALAPLREIKAYIWRYGTERLIFGSDHPFGSPATELNQILSLNLPEGQTQAILADNFRRVCGLE